MVSEDARVGSCVNLTFKTDKGVNRVQRQHDLDWLRVIAFGLLIYFHTAIAFLPYSLPMMNNVESSVGMRMFVAFLQEFRLGLLFMVSGSGVYFALKRRNRSEFFAERSTRLLLPLGFGIAVLVPPMVYMERLFNGQFDGSFLACLCANVGRWHVSSGQSILASLLVCRLSVPVLPHRLAAAELVAQRCGCTAANLLIPRGCSRRGDLCHDRAVISN